MSRLTVVPTPIGNLEDITLRALRILREADILLAEDTRRTRKLLDHYGIARTIKSYHQHNEAARTVEILEALETRDVALVSDAGMPGVSDPGMKLLQAAVNAGIEVDVLPGASAVTTAVVAAAIPAAGFIFLGFLARRAAERRNRIASLAESPFLLVFYEAPHRLLATLTDVETVLGDREIAVCRELSKLHQEIARGSVADVIVRFSSGAVRGECTVVVGPAREARDRFDEAAGELERRLALGEDRRSTIREIASEFGVSRNRLYRTSLQLAGRLPEAGEGEDLDSAHRSRQGA